MRPGYFPMHDDLQVIRLYEMEKCFKDRQFPCRWVPDMGYGYGYPQFNYYGPFPYYAMMVFRLVGVSYLGSVKLFFIFSSIVALVGMFLLGSSLWGIYGGMVSSLIFVYTPYRALDLYVRGAVNELWSLSVMPLIFWSARNLVKEKKYSLIVYALSFSTLLMSHNISSLIVTPLLFLWLLVLLYEYHSEGSSLIRKIKKIFIANFLTFLLSAYYLIPAWFEKKYVHLESMTSGYFDYRMHFGSLRQILLSNYWGYGSSEMGDFDDISLSVGFIVWFLPLLVLVALLLLKKWKRLTIFLFFLFSGWLSLFMVHYKSILIWERIPLFRFIQFPWRFLLFATFAFSVILGSVAILFKTGKQKMGVFLLILFISVLMFSTNFQPSKWLDINDQEKLSGENWERQLTISIFDYLPIYASEPPSSKAPETPVVVSGNVAFLSQAKGSDWQKWDTESLADGSVIRLPIYYFPGWEVKINGKKVATDYNNELGLITVTLYQGQQKIEARLKNTPARTVGNLLTLGGVIGIFGFSLLERKRSKE